MFNKVLVLIFTLFTFSISNSQSTANFELQHDSINIESKNSIFEGRVYSTFWESDDTLIDISFASKN